MIKSMRDDINTFATIFHGVGHEQLTLASRFRAIVARVRPGTHVCTQRPRSACILFLQTATRVLTRGYYTRSYR